MTIMRVLQVHSEMAEDAYKLTLEKARPLPMPLLLHWSLRVGSR